MLNLRQLYITARFIMFLMTFIFIYPPYVIGQSFRIIYPKNGATQWDGEVRGTGAKVSKEKEVTIQVYIRTDIDYLQGDANITSSGRWSLDTYPTEGVINVVYAKLIDSDGRTIRRTPEVKVDLRGSLEDADFFLEVENVAKKYSPLDIADYFINGIYSKSMVRVSFDSQYDDFVKLIAVHIQIEKESGRKYMVKPKILKSTFNLTRQRAGVYQGEIHLKAMGSVIGLLTAYAGLPTGAGESVTSLLDSTPSVYIDEVIISDKKGKKYNQSVYEYLERLFEDLDPQTAGKVIHR